MIKQHYGLEAASLNVASVDAGYNTDSYRSPLQLHGVDVDLKPGELVAVIGPNGSGKSTLVRVLSRTLAPVRGSVLLDFADLYKSVSARESAQSIGVVPQTTDFFLDFTIRDIVSMGRAPLRRRRGALGFESLEDEQAVSAALARMSIPEDLAARPISQVSGGERQRALIARALAQEANILLLDEPTASLDLYNQGHLLKWLRRLVSEDRKAVLVVLHDLNLAAEYADRIVVLSEGRVVANGSTSEVLTSEMLQSVYNVRALIHKNPLSGRPVALPVEGISNPPTDLSRVSGRRVHLFCGAGTGAMLMFHLQDAGAIVTACALQMGDLDEDVATNLNIEHARASAFCRPDQESAVHAGNLAVRADAAIVTDVPIGDINIDNVRQAVEFAATGKPMVVAKSRDGKDSKQRETLMQQLRVYTHIQFVDSVADTPVLLNSVLT